MEICKLVLRLMKTFMNWLETVHITIFFLHSTVFGFIYMIISPIIIYYIFNSRYWLVLLAYSCWYYYNRNTNYEGGSRIRFTGYNPSFRTVTNYFSTKIVKTADLSPDKNYIFACYPHGVFGASLHGNFLSAYSNVKKLFPGLRISVASIDLFFKIPLFREYGLGLGLISCHKESINYVLNGKEKGNCVMLFPGGGSEAKYAIPGKYKIILKKRKGFIKVALQAGCSLVPVFGFGDNDLFEPIEFSPDSRFSKLRESFWKYTGFYYYLPKSIVPKRVPVTSVVGKPINLPKITNPTNEEIDRYHALFTEELIKLFNEHKSKYVEKPEETELEIVE